MEERLNIVHREQGRIACRGFVEVTHIDDDGTMVHAFRIDILRQDLVHPRARAFTCAREIIGVEDADEAAIRFGHFEYLHFGIIHRHILQLLKLHTVQLGSHTKSTFAYIVEFEIRLDFFLIEGIFGLAQFLCIEPPIPGLQFFSGQVFVQKSLQFSGFAFGCFERRCPNGLQESVHGLMVLGHAVSEDIVGGVVVAEEFGFLDTQFHLTNDDGFVVVIVVMVSTRGIVHEQLFAKFAVLTVLKNRREGSALRCEEPLARMSGGSSFFGSCSFGGLRQTC